MRPTGNALKRLFAKSGNRCAFPKCTATLVVNETLIGEVCHIRGNRPGAARYDEAQTEADRQSYENLIALCPTHHTVVDDDDTAYTVGRLLKMKSDHEQHNEPMAEAEASRVAVSYFAASFSNVSQSGGISAQNIHAQTLNVNNAPAADAALQERRVRAVESLWACCERMKKAFGQLTHALDILTDEEIAKEFENGWRPYFGEIPRFANPNHVISLLERTAAMAAESERPFVSQRTWSVFFVLRAVYGRLGYLFERSFEDGTYRPWVKDNGINQLLRTTLPANVVEQIKARPMGGMRSAIDHLEEQFLAETDMRAT